MASVVFEAAQDAAVAVGRDDVVFCVVILCLSVLSMVIFAASSSVAGDGEGEGKQRWRSGTRANGPVFVGGWGCACGGCRVGAGVCGTYLS